MIITITHIPNEPLFDEPLFAVGTEFTVGHFANSLWFGCWPEGITVEWNESEWVVEWNPWPNDREAMQWITDGTERYGPTRSSPLSLVRLGKANETE